MTDQPTPSRRAGLRDEIADALEAADYRQDMRRGDLADAIMPVLYREWPWLRTEAEDAAIERVRNLAERWTAAGPPPLGTSVSRWWDRRLAELHAAILSPEPSDPTAAEQQLAAIIEVARTKGVISIDGIRKITYPPKERR